MYVTWTCIWPNTRPNTRPCRCVGYRCRVSVRVLNILYGARLKRRVVPVWHSDWSSRESGTKRDALKDGGIGRVGRYQVRHGGDCERWVAVVCDVGEQSCDSHVCVWVQDQVRRCVCVCVEVSWNVININPLERTNMQDSNRTPKPQTRGGLPVIFL